MLELTLSDVLKAVGAEKTSASEDFVFSGVSTDTRSIRPGELYVPLRGENFDGHAFIDKALKAGAVGFVYGPSAEPGSLKTSAVAIPVLDSLQALGDIARALIRKSTLPTLAITGSAGKTSTKDMAAAMLATAGPVCATPGNFNNLVGLPLTVFRCEPEHQFLLLEMGMNAPGEIARLTEIAEPDVGVVTNIGAAHIGAFGSLEGVAAAKGELFEKLEKTALAVVNADDSRVVDQYESRCAARRRSFGRCPSADVRIGEISMTATGTTETTVLVAGNEHALRLGVLGTHNVWNAAAALAATLDFLPDVQRALDTLVQHRGPKNRMERFERHGAVVLSDCYNANPKSMTAALETLSAIPVAQRRVAVLGDMLELGEHADAAHRQVGWQVARLGFDELYAVGEFAHAMAEAARSAGLARVHTAEDVLALSLDLKPGDWMLIKGSRGLKMERLLASLGLA